MITVVLHYFLFFHFLLACFFCVAVIKSSPSLRVAVPTQLLIRLRQFAVGTNVIWQFGPEPPGLFEVLFDVNHLPLTKTVEREREKSGFNVVKMQT